MNKSRRIYPDLYGDRGTNDISVGNGRKGFTGTGRTAGTWSRNIPNAACDRAQDQPVANPNSCSKLPIMHTPVVRYAILINPK